MRWIGFNAGDLETSWVPLDNTLSDGYDEFGKWNHLGQNFCVKSEKPSTFSKILLEVILFFLIKE